MGDLKIGDEICGTRESIQKVIDIFPKGVKTVYKVIFENGQEVECCEDHLWSITTNNGKSKTLPLKKIIEDGLYNDYRGYKRYKYYIPQTSVNFQEQGLEIDPFLLGVLLGDGFLGEDLEFTIGLNKINNIIAW